MAEMKRKRREDGGASWLTTYSDMVTLLLTFFVMMMTTARVDGSELKLILAYFNGMGVLTGGNTLSVGKMAELGNTFESLPSVERGSSMNQAREQAISEFQPEIASRKVRVQLNERGLVITLASDAFFEKGSARVEIDRTRNILKKLSSLLEGMPEKTFRIEGHTDDLPTDPDGSWRSNWELSTARATNVLHYLLDYADNPNQFEKQFQVAGFADTRPYEEPVNPSSTRTLEEIRALNRRVDVIILSDGLL